MKMAQEKIFFIKSLTAEGKTDTQIQAELKKKYGEGTSASKISEIRNMDLLAIDTTTTTTTTTDTTTNKLTDEHKDVKELIPSRTKFQDEGIFKQISYFHELIPDYIKILLTKELECSVNQCKNNKWNTRMANIKALISFFRLDIKIDSGDDSAKDIPRNERKNSNQN